MYVRTRIGNNKTLTAVDGVNDENQLAEEQTVELTLPVTILQDIPEGEPVSVAVAVFDETTLFPVREQPTNQVPEDTGVLITTVVGSPVVSIQLAGVPDGTDLTMPIRLVLRINQVESMNGTNETISNPVCVFWDFTLSGKWLIVL